MLRATAQRRQQKMTIEVRSGELSLFAAPGRESSRRVAVRREELRLGFSFGPFGSHHSRLRPAYLITRSARASTFGGIVRPICLAVFRLITKSNCLGCSTGKSAGLLPLRIRST